MIPRACALSNDHGFRVVVVDPQDEHWVPRVLEAVAGVQAQLARQKLPQVQAAAILSAEVYSS